MQGITSISFLKEIGVIAVISTVISSVVSTAIVLIIKHRYEIKIELLKADLLRSINEQSVKFSSIYIQKTKILSELYSVLIRTKRDFSDSLRPHENATSEEHLNQNWRKADEIYDSLYNFYEENRLYLNNNICDELDKIIEIYKKASALYQTRLVSQSMGVKDNELNWECFEALRDIQSGSIPKLLRSIEIESRNILNIND